MQKPQTNNQSEVTIDVSSIARTLWKRAWILCLAMVLCFAVTYLYSATMITPTYRSGFTTYVNNRITSSTTVGSTTVNDLSASMGLAYVYQEVIISRSVLTEAAQMCGEDMRDGTATATVTAEVSENAPIISVYVEATDPALAVRYAEAIAEVAPEHVNRVVEGSSMKIVDPPLLPNGKYSPNNFRNGILGALVGLVLAAAVLIVLELVHDEVQSAEDLERRYQITVLGSIPDMAAAEKDDGNHYGYGYGYAARARSEQK